MLPKKRGPAAICKGLTGLPSAPFQPQALRIQHTEKQGGRLEETPHHVLLQPLGAGQDACRLRCRKNPEQPAVHQGQSQLGKLPETHGSALGHQTEIHPVRESLHFCQQLPAGRLAGSCQLADGGYRL